MNNSNMNKNSVGCSLLTFTYTIFDYSEFSCDLFNIADGRSFTVRVTSNKYHTFTRSRFICNRLTQYLRPATVIDYDNSNNNTENSNNRLAVNVGDNRTNIITTPDSKLIYDIVKKGYYNGNS